MIGHVDTIANSAGVQVGAVGAPTPMVTRVSALDPHLGIDQAQDVFVGRVEQIQGLLQLLKPTAGTVTREVLSPPAHERMLVCAIQGMGGIGKTALVGRAAGIAVHHGWFTGGAVWVDLRGYDPAATGLSQADHVYAPVLRALGVPREDIPETSAQQATEYHHLLDQRASEGRPVLVVLDNAAETTQVNRLIPRPGTLHRVVITSRDALDLPTATKLEVKSFTAAEARDLWRAILVRAKPGDPRLAENHADETEAILETCAGLPLAIKIAAGIAADEPDLDLTNLAAELTDQAGRLAALTNDVGGVAGTISVSWNRLRHRDPQAARLLALLALHPGPDFDLHAASSIYTVLFTAGQEATPTQTHLRALTRTQTHLRALTRTHLLDTSTEVIGTASPPNPGSTSARVVEADIVSAGGSEAAPTNRGVNRWRFHDLVAIFLRERACRDIGIDAHVQEAAVEALLKYYRLLTAMAIERVEALPGELATFPEVFADRQQALSWLDAERATLVAAVALAYDTHRWETTTRLVGNLATYWSWRRMFADWLRLGELALRAAKHLDDPTEHAHALNNLAIAWRTVPRLNDSIAAYRTVVDIYRQTGDRKGEGDALINLGILLQEAESVEEAISVLAHAIDICQQTGNRRRVAVAYDNIGVALRKQKRFTDAIDNHNHALAIFKETGDLHGEGAAWGNRGIALYEAGSLDNAIENHTIAANIYQETGDRHSRGVALQNIGIALVDLGQLLEARDRWESAVSEFTKSGDHQSAEMIEGWLNDLESNG